MPANPLLPQKHPVSFVSRSRSLRPQLLSTRAAKLVDTPPVMVIQGQPVGSKEEYYTGKALDILGYKYDYQHAVNYGRSRRGGQVLDFLVYTPITWTDLEVNGTYWHTGHRNDMLDMQRVTRQHGWRLVIAWDYNVPSIAAAVSFLRFHLV